MQQAPLRELLLRLWLTPATGAVFIQKILQALDSPEVQLESACNFQTWSTQQLARLAQVPVARLQQAQTELASEHALAQELAWVERENARLVTILDADYPAPLKQIYAPPTVLVVKGEFPACWQNSIAIVGSRDAKPYAAQSLDLLLPSLVANSFVTVSGGAVGVDTMVHQKTLALGGQTFAVLGAGLNQIFPAENRGLFAKIAAEGGAIISPFPMNMHASKITFPARNRIIAGLAPACLVIQAAAKSGALITANFALEQNREVLTIPAPITAPHFAGNNKLLQAGAGLVTSALDIFKALGLDAEEEQTSFLAKAGTQPETELSSELPLLRFLQTAIGCEELADKTGMEFDLLQETLFELQLAAKVKQNLNGTWIKI